jgi:hypothetical protein
MDVDEPFHNLHCFVVKEWKSNWNDVDWLACLFLQPTHLKKGQFKRYGKSTFSAKEYNFKSYDLKGRRIQNQEWLEFEEYGSDRKYIISII